MATAKPPRADDKRVSGTAKNPKKVAASSATKYKAPAAPKVKGAKRAGRPKVVK